MSTNLQFELEQFARRNGARVTFNKEAREAFLRFATSPGALWSGNFRDLNGAVVRMATLARGGRITTAIAEEEIARLRALWSSAEGRTSILERILDPEAIAAIDPFDRVQLEHAVEVARRSRSLSEAGRMLFAASRQRRRSTNDADRLRKYLGRFGIEWAALRDAFAPQRTGDDRPGTLRNR